MFEGAFGFRAHVQATIYGGPEHGVPKAVRDVDLQGFGEGGVVIFGLIMHHKGDDVKPAGEPRVKLHGPLHDGVAFVEVFGHAHKQAAARHSVSVGGVKGDDLAHGVLETVLVLAQEIVKREAPVGELAGLATELKGSVAGFKVG